MLLSHLWFSQDICPVVGMLGHMVIPLLDFKESPYCFPQWLYQFTFPPAVQEGSLFSTVGICCVTQGAQHCSQTTQRGEMGREMGEASGGRGRTYTCGRLMWMYGRNQHNIVQQLSSNLKKRFRFKVFLREKS